MTAHHDSALDVIAPSIPADEDLACVTPTQRRLLAAVVQHCTDNRGAAPTIRWLCGYLGISSTSVVNYHLNKLVACGIIRRHDMLTRGIEVIGATWEPPPELAHLVREGAA